jgi:hypothetical protein
VDDPQLPEVPDLHPTCIAFLTRGTEEYTALRSKIRFHDFGNNIIALRSDGLAVFTLKLYTDGKSELTFELAVILDDNGFVEIFTLKNGK